MLKIIVSLSIFIIVVLGAWAVHPVAGVFAAALGYGVLNGVLTD